MLDGSRCGHSLLRAGDVEGGAPRAAPLVQTGHDACMGLRLHMRGEVEIDLLQFLDVHSAVVAHLVQLFQVVEKGDVHPILELHLLLFPVTKVVRDVVQLVRVEVKVVRRPGLGVNCLVERDRREAVEKDAGLEPLEIEAIPEVRHELIGFGSYECEVPQHLLVILIRAPPQDMDFLFSLPLIPDADDLPLIDDGIMAEGNLPADPESQYHIRGDFDVPK